LRFLHVDTRGLQKRRNLRISALYVKLIAEENVLKPNDLMLLTNALLDHVRFLMSNALVHESDSPSKVIVITI
jgi:hypothetical protein